MIAVIADDFTGAAEIGGVGLRYGLKVLIETEVNHATDVDLLVIATDIRSLDTERAAVEITKITCQLLELNPVVIFKKIDSVLRGHVAAELEAQMKAMGKARALIVAANPSLGRTIVNGQYFVGGVPLAETSFSDDPDFPVHTSVVTDIVTSDHFPVVSIEWNREIPLSGLVIANVATPDDLRQWAGRITSDMVIAGGSGFFSAYLQSLNYIETGMCDTELSFGNSSLFILGSKFPKCMGLPEKFQGNDVVRSNMPENVFRGQDYDDASMEQWVRQIINQLQAGLSVMVTIEHQPIQSPDLSLRIRENIGKMVEKVAKNVALNELFIEGGATASVVFKYLGISKLIPFCEVEFGVIQMRAPNYPNLCITTKPGSYLWPENLKFKKSEPIN